MQPRFTGALLIDAGAAPRRRAPVFDDRARARRRPRSSLSRHSSARHGRVDERRSDSPSTRRRSASSHLTLRSPAAHLSEILRGSRQAIKKVLMDQRALAGVGNIYANEALWRAGIDPSRAADRVTARRGERACATPSSACSPSRSRTAARASATIATRAAVAADSSNISPCMAARAKPCPRCGARLIGTHAIDGRMTVLCARCQK